METSNFTVVINGKEYPKKDFEEAYEFLSLAVLNGDIKSGDSIIIKIKDLSHVCF